MVVGLAVGLPVSLEEVPGAQLLRAVGAREVLRVPRLPQRGDDLAHYGLLAGVAAAFLARVDSLAAHVCLEVAKHRIQVLLGRRLRLGGLRRTVRRVGDGVVLRLALVDLEQMGLIAPRLGLGN